MNRKACGKYRMHYLPKNSTLFIERKRHLPELELNRNRKKQVPLRCTCFFSCVSHKCTQKQFFFFCFVFLYDSIVYGDAFQTWLNINEWAFLSLLNARWLCELLWKHIYFLIDEIHIKNTNTNMLLTQIHLDAFTIYTILFSLVFNLFAHFFFSSQEKTNFPLSMSLPLILPCACIFMRRHGS